MRWATSTRFFCVFVLENLKIFKIDESKIYLDKQGEQGNSHRFWGFHLIRNSINCIFEKMDILRSSFKDLILQIPTAYLVAYLCIRPLPYDECVSCLHKAQNHESRTQSHPLRRPQQYKGRPNQTMFGQDFFQIFFQH
jgi:hypothetical protein